MTDNQPPILSVGDPCIYWRDQLPLLETNATAAKVVEVLDGEWSPEKPENPKAGEPPRVRVRVENHRTGRSFNVVAVVSATAAPGAVTPAGVLAVPPPPAAPAPAPAPADDEEDEEPTT